MQQTEKKEFANFLKIIKKLTKSEVQQYLNDINSQGIDKICRCIHNIVYQDIGLKKKKKTQLKNLMKKHRDKVEFLSRRNTSKKNIEEKRKALQSGGFPLLPILSLAIPTILSLFRRN